MTRALRHLLPAVPALALALLAPVAAATVAAAADPVTVTMSDLASEGDTVTGVLTLRSKSDVRIDPDSLSVTVDGEDYPATVEQSPASVRRAMLVIDTSGSMGTEGMSTVRAATKSYLASVPADVAVGVVSFATTAGVDLKPTTDHAEVQKVVNGLRSRGDTSLYAGVASAVKALGGAGDRSIVLLSDGADTVSEKKAADLKALAASLKKNDIRVDIVRFKTDEAEAASALTTMARANAGTVVPAGDEKGVSAAFTASAQALDSQASLTIDVGTALTGSHEIEVTGEAGGAPFSVSRTVTLTPAAGAVPTPEVDGAADGPPANALAFPDVSTTAPPSWFPLTAALLTALGMFLLIAAVLTPSVQTARERRIGAIDEYVMGPRSTSRSERKPEKPKHTPLGEQLSALGERAMEGRRSASWVITQIERADLPFRVGDWALVTLTGAVVGGVVGYVLVRGLPVVGIVLGAVLGVVIPQLVLRHLARRRAKQFEAVLPDVLMLVATSLKSGFGLPQALDAVARDAAEPAAKEFSRALAQTRLGTDIADALDQVADRMDSKSMRWTVMAIRIQREVGGNLAETLLTTARTLREREALHRQVRALSAEGRVSAYILIALPISLFVFMVFQNYEYIQLLWTTFLGLIMIVASIVMMIVGVFWMRRVVRIEV